MRPCVFDEGKRLSSSIPSQLLQPEILLAEYPFARMDPPTMTFEEPPDLPGPTNPPRNDPRLDPGPPAPLGTGGDEHEGVVKTDKQRVVSRTPRLSRHGLNNEGADYSLSRWLVCVFVAVEPKQILISLLHQGSDVAAACPCSRVNRARDEGAVIVAVTSPSSVQQPRNLTPPKKFKEFLENYMKIHHLDPRNTVYVTVRVPK